MNEAVWQNEQTEKSAQKKIEKKGQKSSPNRQR